MCATGHNHRNGESHNHDDGNYYVAPRNVERIQRYNSFSNSGDYSEYRR
ncbi:hypothetical protein HY449_04225 [Candidatus Pacearchaeota archaeon]|nr:hypothetical protein [Candidatus Pacearchaeota archaeon]